MRRHVLSWLAATVALSLSGAAAQAAELSVKRTVTLEASPEATWATIGDFCSLPDWDPGVRKCEIVAGKNNRRGAVRRLTLEDGATLREELVAYDAARRAYSYTILDSPIPVVSYRATISVLPGAARGSVVEWTSTFKAAPGTDDATARKAIEEIYDAGLTSLKAKLETP